jgi:hypothetical protein
LQLRVLRFGLLQDGDFGVGVFPEGDEIVVGCASFRADAVGLRTLQGLCLKRVGATETEMRQSADQSVQYNAGMVEELLETRLRLRCPP